MNETEFLDLTGVAKLLGLTYRTVRTYRVRGSLPPADAQFGRTPVWRPETIRKWNRERPGVSGRPRKRPQESA